jgi:hypothetical protein
VTGRVAILAGSAKSIQVTSPSAHRLTLLDEFFNGIGQKRTVTARRKRTSKNCAES